MCLGDGGCGKTVLLYAYTKKKFDERYIPTGTVSCVIPLLPVLAAVVQACLALEAWCTIPTSFLFHTCLHVVLCIYSIGYLLGRDQSWGAKGSAGDL